MTEPKPPQNPLYEFLTPERKAKFESVLSFRTRYLTVGLEDLYQPHNAAAVLRSCDSMGVQDVYVIQNQNRFKPAQGVTIGADKWLKIEDLSKAGWGELRKRGYRIVATTPHREGYTLQSLPLDQKIALIFGSEKPGLTSDSMEDADAFLSLPMLGFSESFNVSVCAALMVYTLTERIRSSLPRERWQLTEDEKNELRLEWARKSLDQAEAIEKELKNRGIKP